MSDDENDGDYDDEVPPPPAGGADGEPEIDKDGYPISRGGKFQAQLNPLQQKLEKARKEKEEQAKKDAKKAALANRLAAFGGAKQLDAERAAKEKEEAEKKAAAEREKAKIPKAAPAVLDNRVADMMKSECADGEAGTGTRDTWGLLCHCVQREKSNASRTHSSSLPPLFPLPPTTLPSPPPVPLPPSQAAL
jgi:hypothetical protein